LGDVVVRGVKRSFFVGLPRLGSTSAVLCVRTIAVALLLGRSPVLVLRARDVKSAAAPPTFSLQVLIQTSAVPETLTLPMHHAPRKAELQLENQPKGSFAVKTSLPRRHTCPRPPDNTRGCSRRR